MHCVCIDKIWGHGTKYYPLLSIICVHKILSIDPVGKNWDYLNNLSPEDGFSEFTSQINKSLDKVTRARCITIPAKHINNELWMTPGLMTSSKKCGKLF